MRNYDIAIVGAGIVGLASARELLLRRPGLRLAVLEKEAEVAQHQSGHNSGVVHSGVYYAPGSLKAKLCVAGAAEMYRYCEEHGIAVDRCGKVIVALDESEMPRLRNILDRGQKNGVQGLELIGPERLKEIEPNCVGVAAIWSPNTGIADFGAVARSYAREIVEMGGEILVRHGVVGFRAGTASVLLETQGGEVEARHVVTCAGLYADRVAALTGAPADPRIVPFRGDYYVLRQERRHLARNLIYPVPDPAFPFLGVHFTRRVGDGSVWLGPNAVLAFSREGYRRSDVRPVDVVDALRFPGFQKLAARFWRTGLDEMVRDFSKDLFLATLQRYVPELTADDLEEGPSGVRAQALDINGTLVDDFVVNQQGRVVHVRNAPSPAATSALQIGRLVADLLKD